MNKSFFVLCIDSNLLRDLSYVDNEITIYATLAITFYQNYTPWMDSHIFQLTFIRVNHYHHIYRYTNVCLLRTFALICSRHKKITTLSKKNIYIYIYICTSYMYNSC